MIPDYWTKSFFGVVQLWVSRGIYILFSKKRLAFIFIVTAEYGLNNDRQKAFFPLLLFPRIFVLGMI